ncbi:MAG: hypothetical protein NTZ60_01625 [Campylobacterales bacterium]|nr:hypothetical protein [Campylobacterales bacterium]
MLRFARNDGMWVLDCFVVPSRNDGMCILFGMAALSKGLREEK